MEKFKNYEIMIGLNDMKSHVQVIPTDTAIDTIGKTFGSCTIQKCIGFYNGEKEISLKVTVYGVMHEKAREACQKIRRLLNQECVILTDIKEQTSDFVYD